MEAAKAVVEEEREGVEGDVLRCGGGERRLRGGQEPGLTLVGPGTLLFLAMLWGGSGAQPHSVGALASSNLFYLPARHFYVFHACICHHSSVRSPSSKAL